MLASCEASKKSEREALMDRIESQVRMPEGSRPLAEYARHYAENAEGEVVGVYVPPNRNGRLLKRRQWLEDQRDLPFLMDGGCNQVTVLFDKTTSTVTHADCNGVA